jgi:hypothetical protein
MRHRRSPIAIAAMFVVFAAAFSVIFWPEVSVAAKLAFFITGAGFGIGVAGFVRRPSRETRPAA